MNLVPQRISCSRETIVAQSHYTIENVAGVSDVCQSLEIQSAGQRALSAGAIGYLLLPMTKLTSDRH